MEKIKCENKLNGAMSSKPIKGADFNIFFSRRKGDLYKSLGSIYNDMQETLRVAYKC
jgi:hypothetical protein